MPQATRHKRARFKVVVHKHMEHWGIGAHSLHASEAVPEEYAEPATEADKPK